MDAKPTTQNAFAQATQAGPHTGALIIDIQLGTISKMEPQDAQTYLDALGRSIDALRSKNIPVTWVTIGDQDRLFQPEWDNAPLDIAALTERGFLDRHDGSPQDSQNYEALKDFLNSHQGPRSNETVSTKTAMDSFENAVLANYLKFQGTPNLLLMGAVSSRCVLESAIGAAHYTLKPTVITDRILSWSGNELTSPLGWQGLDHHSMIRNALTDRERGYSPTQLAEATAIKFTTFGEAMGLSARPQRIPLTTPQM